jgi:two-component system sensor histidine kinase KdpD
MVTRGELRVYLGAAPGVGKTFAMLDEAHRRSERGAEVMVGCIDTHGRPHTQHQLEQFAAGRALPIELDVDAVLAARPRVVLVDDLAHRNPVGSERKQRWHDVDVLLNAGIDVITTLDVQHIQSLADPVQRIIGRMPTELVPDDFLRRADQIELVDVTPEAIRRRIAHGNVFAADELEPASAELYQTNAFAELRALLLFWLADRLTAGADDPREARERVVVAVTGGPGSEAVVRRAARLAHRSRAQLIGVHVRRPRQAHDGPALAAGRALVLHSGGSFHEIEGTDVAAALVEFAETERATQLVMGTSGRRRVDELFSGSIINSAVRQAGRIDIHVISYPTAARRHIAWRWVSNPVISRTRRLTAWLAGIVVLAALTVLLHPGRDSVAVSNSLALYLLLVVVIAALGGFGPGLAAAIVAPLVANWFLIPPLHTLRINDADNALSLAVFISVAVIVSAFVSVSARWAAEAGRARQEAQALAALAGTGGTDPLQSITDQLQHSFDLDGVSVLRGLDSGAFVVEASSGTRPPATPDESDFHETIAAGVLLAARGRTLTADDHRVLRSFIQQLTRALEQHRLAAVAAQADALEQADALRTSMLRAVSHDLRTPLAGIKASVSSLRQRDVLWPAAVQDEFLETIEDETDRLTSIVANLLDLSRLQAGGLRPALRRLSMEEVLPSALHSLGHRADDVELDVPADLPDVWADPALLERVIANVVSNAITWSPVDRPVRLRSMQRDDHVLLYVVDHGPGIHPKDRATVVQPFHRLGDAATHHGLGLGLAIANGLTTAMDGTLELRDTPGGGLTVVMSLPAVGVVDPTNGRP